MFDTPNRTISGVPVGWWRSGAEKMEGPNRHFSLRYKTGVVYVVFIYGASSCGIAVKNKTAQDQILQKNGQVTILQILNLVLEYTDHCMCTQLYSSEYRLRAWACDKQDF
jgi:hypothetical protein